MTACIVCFDSNDEDLPRAMSNTLLKSQFQSKSEKSTSESSTTMPMPTSCYIKRLSSLSSPESTLMQAASSSSKRGSRERNVAPTLTHPNRATWPRNDDATQPSLLLTTNMHCSNRQQAYPNTHPYSHPRTTSSIVRPRHPYDP